MDLPRFRGGLGIRVSGLTAFCSPVWWHSFVRPPAEPFFHPRPHNGAAAQRRSKTTPLATLLRAWMISCLLLALGGTTPSINNGAHAFEGKKNASEIAPGPHLTIYFGSSGNRVGDFGGS
jgi:hypothetical protein